jgi:hypothetical protein
MRTPSIFAFAAFLLSTSAAAAECDFSATTTGMCEASIAIQNPSSSNGRFSADLLINSSAECSKVDYRNGQSLETSYIRNGTSTESLSSPAPIEPSDIAVTSCQAFGSPGAAPTKTVAQTPADTPPEPKDGTLTGRWNSNYYVYWDLWDQDGKILGTLVNQLDPKKPTYSYLTGTRKGKSLTLKDISPLLLKIKNEYGSSTFTDRIVSPDVIKNSGGNVTMTRQREQDVDRTVRTVAGQWIDLTGDVTYSLTDDNGILKGTGSSIGAWPEITNDPTFDAKVDLVIEGSRKANEVTLKVKDKSGKITSTRYGMRNDHSLWKDGSIAMIRN